MAAARYLKQQAGQLVEQPATTASAGAADDGKIVGLDAAGRIDASMMPVGIGAPTKAIQASEALAAGDYVNIHAVTGAFRVRKADGGTNGKWADGFVLAGVASAALATIFFDGINTAVSAQTPGPVFLSDATPGLGIAAAPVGAGKTVHRVGTALSAAEVMFEPGQPILLA